MITWSFFMVEDNEHDRIAFQRAMSKGCVDCNLAICERAEEGENLLNSPDDTFDLVVLDFNLPGRQKNLPP
jgi:hypothetical protein